MRKGAILMMILFSLTACQSENSESPTFEESWIGGPIEKTWGELSCQKTSQCSNPVLNMEVRQIKRFFAINFSTQENHLNSFSCGQFFYEQWMRDMPSQSFMDEQSFHQIIEFTLKVVDPKSCLLKDDLINNMNQYFRNTKEYKNEI